MRNENANGAGTLLSGSKKASKKTQPPQLPPKPLAIDGWRVPLSPEAEERLRDLCAVHRVRPEYVLQEFCENWLDGQSLADVGNLEGTIEAAVQREREARQGRRDRMVVFLDEKATRIVRRALAGDEMVESITDNAEDVVSAAVVFMLSNNSDGRDDDQSDHCLQSAKERRESREQKGAA